MALLDDLRTALEENQQFSVLIDKDDLQPGDPWRQTLNTWIGGCNIAIVLLNSITRAAHHVDRVEVGTDVYSFGAPRLIDFGLRMNF